MWVLLAEGVDMLWAESSTEFLGSMALLPRYAPVPAAVAPRAEAAPIAGAETFSVIGRDDEESREEGLVVVVVAVGVFIGVEVEYVLLLILLLWTLGVVLWVEVDMLLVVSLTDSLASEALFPR